VTVTSEALEFFVVGLPIAQGSKKSYGNGVWAESNIKELRPWRMAVATDAHAAAGHFQFFGAVVVALDFQFKRPLSHYGTGRNEGQLKDSSPTYKTSAPDIDKLCRAVLDGLAQCGVLRNDAQVVSLMAKKVYDNPQGVKVVIRHV